MPSGTYQTTLKQPLVVLQVLQLTISPSAQTQDRHFGIWRAGGLGGLLTQIPNFKKWASGYLGVRKSDCTKVYHFDSVGRAGLPTDTPDPTGVAGEPAALVAGVARSS